MSRTTNLTVSPNSDGTFNVTVDQNMTADMFQGFLDKLQEAGADAFVSALTALVALPDTDQPAEKPKRTRRTKAQIAEDKAAEEAAAAEALKPSRRRGATTPTEITDADVTKAASEAAAALSEQDDEEGNKKNGPGIIMQVLEEDFKVSNAGDIPQEDRQKFIDTLEFEVGS